MRSSLAWSALAVALISGCGGDDTTNQNSGTITMPSILMKTGAFANLYPILSGSVALAVKTVNDAGGVLGNKLVVTEFDEASGTAAGTQPVVDIVNQIVADDKFQVLMGPYVSDSVLAVGQTAGDNERLMITPIGGANAISAIDDHDFVFRGLETPSLSAEAAAVGSIQNGAHTAAVLHLNFATGNEFAQTFADRFTREGGTIQVNHAYNVDPSNLASFHPQDELDAVFAGNPDVIYIYGSSADAVALLQTWKKADWSGTWVLGIVLVSPEIVQAAGAAKMQGTVGYTAAPADAAKQKAVVDAFQAFNGFSATQTAVPLINSILNSVYMATLAIEKAGVYNGVKARDALRDIANAPGEQVVGTVDYAGALAVVKSGNDLDYVGLTSAIEYDENGDFPANVGEYTFDASGNLVPVKVLVTGVDF